MNEAPALRISGLDRTFHQGGRELAVLRGLDLQVARGEAVEWRGEGERECEGLSGGDWRGDGGLFRGARVGTSEGRGDTKHPHPSSMASPSRL